MLIRRIHYPISTLGPHQRLGIWTMGCSHGCSGCIAKDTWNFDQSKYVAVQDILTLAKDYFVQYACSSVTISGGDPFFQTDLFELLEGLKKIGYTDILVYSGFTIEQLNENQSYKRCLTYIDVLIDGLYIEELNHNTPLRGSDNQKIIFLNDSLFKSYENILKGSRSLEYVKNGSYIDIYGIVPKNFKKYWDELHKK